MRDLEGDQPVVSHIMTRSRPADSHNPRRTAVSVELTGLSAKFFPDEARHIGHGYSLRFACYSRIFKPGVRSTTAPFGGSGMDSRATGQYIIILGLLHLVESLARQAYSTILLENNKLKEEMPLRAMRFVHSGIWVEYLSWKYVRLGDRFEIGKTVLELYI
jgi:nuclear pore complex protein Nup188